MNRLLLLSCSQRKRSDPGRLPAIERYDGPPFRVLRRYLATVPVDPPEVLILSARFGVIDANRPIEAYDQIMTRDRAVELRARVAAEIEYALVPIERSRCNDERLLVCMGKTYLAALTGVPEPMLSVLRSRAVEGGQGQKLSRLRAWLYGNQ